MLIIIYVIDEIGSLNFNTSHVNVNHKALETVKAIRRYFNTSHVNVNLTERVMYTLLILISIHLMLMLIIAEKEASRFISIFQYISC